MKKMEISDVKNTNKKKRREELKKKRENQFVTVLQKMFNVL